MRKITPTSHLKAASSWKFNTRVGIAQMVMIEATDGVLAPHAKLRPQIVPSAPVNAREACDHHAQTPPASAPARIGLQFWP